MKKQYPEYLVLALFSLISFVMMLRHEPWADEAQAWLLARDSQSLLEMLSYAGYEGSPMLWHLFLYIFSHLGLPMLSMRIFHTFCAIGTAYLVLFRSSFERYQRILAIFGYYFIFEYNVIARSYVLSVLLLSYLCSIYKQRYDIPIKYGIAVALLVQTNVHSMIFGLVLVGVNLLENTVEYRTNWQAWKSTAPIYMIFGFSIVFSIFLLLPPDDLPAFIADWDSIRARNPIGFFLFFVMRGFFPMQTTGENFWSYNLRVSMFTYQQAIIVGLVIVIFTMYLTYQKIYPLLIILPIYIGYGILFVYKRGICPRHCGLMYIAFFYVYWISLAYPTVVKLQDLKKLEVKQINLGIDHIPQFNGKQVRSLLFTSFLIIQMFSSPIPLYHDYTENFSNAKPVADYLIEQNYTSDDTILAAHSWFPTMGILPHLPDNHQQFYFLSQERYGSYVVWNARFFSSQALSIGEIVNRSLDAFHEFNPESFILILDFEVNEVFFYSHFDILRYFEDALIGDENYYVYKLKSNNSTGNIMA